jgi:hypothetical protein
VGVFEYDRGVCGGGVGIIVRMAVRTIMIVCVVTCSGEMSCDFSGREVSTFLSCVNDCSGEMSCECSRREVSTLCAHRMLTRGNLIIMLDTSMYDRKVIVLCFTGIIIASILYRYDKPANKKGLAKTVPAQ